MSRWRRAIPRLWEARDAEIPALKGALATLETLNFSNGRPFAADGSRIKKLTRLHRNFGRCHEQSKSARRAGLAPEIP